MASDQHPLIAEHLAKFGVAHTSLGRNLRGNRVGRRKTASEDGQPLSHEDQEKRLADTKMWVPHRAFEPASIAKAGASAFASKIHLPDPHTHGYDHVQTNVGNLRDIGRAYDKLPTRDPSAIPHFERMRDEIKNQHDHLTHTMGIKTEVVDHDPYPTVHHMVQDVVNNKRIKVLSTKVTGGHDFLTDDDNDKFRAVHDVFGHAATGRGFDAHGEEAAWLAHSKMFTPHARGAMSSETRGQNSALHINGTFQAQKTALLPRHMWDDTAVSKHLSSLDPRSRMSFPHDEHSRSRPKEWQAGAEKGWEDAKEGYMEFENPHHDKMHDGKGFGDGWDHAVGLYNEPDDYDYWSSHKDQDPQAKTSSHQGILPFEQFHLASLVKQAHDSGDGETIYHCPFCGSGQVIARSDRTIECEFCHTCFTVQVQPQYPAFPQTVNGVPVQVPGMPGQVGADPAGAGGLPVDPMADPNAAGGGFPPAGGDGGGFPPEDEDDDEEEEEASGGNPFAASLRTAAGKALAPDDFIAHLALKHTQDRDSTLAAVRARRG